LLLLIKIIITINDIIFNIIITIINDMIIILSQSLILELKL